MRRNIQCILLSISLFGTACGEEKTEPFKGTLQVFVRLIDENGNEINDRSNVKVTVDENLVAYSDATGKSEFKGLMAGTYNIRAEKEDFDVAKSFKVPFAGGEVPGVISDVRLYQHPSVELESIVAETTTSAGIGILNVHGGVTESFFLHLSFYLSTDSLVTNKNYKYSFSEERCCGDITSFAHVGGFDYKIFTPGQKAYIVIYARSLANVAGSIYRYYDFDSEEYIQPGEKRLTKSPLKVIVP